MEDAEPFVPRCVCCCQRWVEGCFVLIRSTQSGIGPLLAGRELLGTYKEDVELDCVNDSKMVSCALGRIRAAGDAGQLC